MKKLIAIVAVILAFAANADYLYWMVDTTSAGAYAYDTVKLVSEANGAAIDTITLTDPGMGDLSGVTLNDKLSTYQSTYGLALETELRGNSYTSFLVELWNGDSWTAQSKSISYETLLANSIYQGGVGTPAVPASFGTYAVPEPTSGLLFLIGGMLLGLRRRRQQV